MQQMYTALDVVDGRRADESIPGAPAPIADAAQSKGLLVATVASAVIFLVALLLKNLDLFRQPSYEWGDYAANAIQIQNAKHLHELLGNYSRWGFHHPGPAFFYVFAAGEALFHDALHLVPQAINAQVLTIVIVNLVFLFASLYIVSRHSGSPWFLAPAIASSVSLIYTINRTVSAYGVDTALSSIWMPHVLLFCFLFFLVSSAAVACGEVRYLSVSAFTGLMLVHGHVAQALFVAVLTVMMIAALVWQRWRQGSLRTLLREARTQLIVCGALVGVFAAPILIDAVLHHPSNIDAIRAYVRDQVSFPTTPRQAFRYELSFFTFVQHPEAGLPSSRALLRSGFSHAYVRRYWAVILVLIACIVAVRMRRRLVVPPFVRYLMLELAVVCLLFFYWSLKIAGEMWNFNGYFFYAVQFAGIFCLLGVLISSLPAMRRAVQKPAFALCFVAPLLLFCSPRSFTFSTGHAEDINRIAVAAEGRAPMLQLVFAPDDWPTAVGVASRFQRVHQAWCVAPWSVLFPPGAVCDATAGVTKLVLTRNSTPCVAPCQVLVRDDGLTAELAPYPWLKLPVTLGTDEALAQLQGFYGEGREGDPRWTSSHAAIRFLLAAAEPGASRVRIRVTSDPRPGRPAEIRLNGHLVGSVAYGQAETVDFTVPGQWFRPAAENEVTFSVPHAGPIGQDVRHLGVMLHRVELSAAHPE